MGLNPVFIPVFGGKPGNSLVKQSLSAQPLLLCALSGSSLFSHLKSQKAFKLQEKSIFGGLEHPVTAL